MLAAMLGLVFFAGGQGLGLLVVQVLQAMFQIAQEGIGFLQLGHGGGFQQAQFGQPVQRGAGAAQLQAFVAATANQLEYLGDEFHFTDAAWPQLDIVGHVAPGHFAANLGVQLAHGTVGVVIQILAVDEGAHHVGEAGDIAGQCLGLDPGIAFPFAALGEQVVFQRRKAHHQRAGVAVRAQAHVDTEYLAIQRDVIDQADDALAHLAEVFVIADLARAAGFAAFGVDEDQVDVGRYIQFATAQLAHADDDELLHFAAVLADGLAVLRQRAAGAGQ
jgi:hypothetical protein